MHTLMQVSPQTVHCILQTLRLDRPLFHHDKSKRAWHAAEIVLSRCVGSSCLIIPSPAKQKIEDSNVLTKVGLGDRSDR